MFPSGSHHTRVYSDKNILWRPGRIYVPALRFTGMSVSAINEGGAANDAYGVNWESSHTSAPYSKEISTFGINGLLMNTDGMMVNHDMQAPHDLDVSKTIRCRLHWTCGSSDTADTVLWKMLYLALIPEVTALKVPDVAFDTVLAQDTVPAATAYTINQTSWAVINPGTISALAEHLAFNIEMDTKDTDMAEDLFLLGLEIAYSPKRLRGPDGMAQDAVLPVSLLDNRY